MADVMKYEPGTFSWSELGTTDSAAAKRFYEELFGWTYADTPGAPDMVYTSILKRGKSVGGLYQMGERQKGMHSHWMPYVSVASADQSAGKVKGLGGEVKMPAFDVRDLGRMAVLSDPAGAMFSIWEPRKNPGAAVVREPGTLTWNELHTNDTKKAASFYGGLFGWTVKTGGDYTEFVRADGTPVGGMMEIRKEWGPVPPNWLTYFAVENCDSSTARAGSQGGGSVLPPMDIPGIGRFSILRDPQGAVFALFQRAD